MAYKVQRPCKVCGKLYTPCADCEKDKSAFHWRTVACSPECGKKYFEMVMKARNKSKAKTKAKKEPENISSVLTEPNPGVDNKSKESESKEQIEL